MPDFFKCSRWFLVVFVAVSFTSYQNMATNELFARNILIITACGSDGTRNGTCPSDRGICTIDPSSLPSSSNNSGYCICLNGYFGINCEYGPFCNNSNECSGNGRCSIIKSDIGEYIQTCVCNPGFFGQNCEQSACLPNICENGGTCAMAAVMTGQTSYYCKCPHGFFGRNCQFDQDRFGADNRIL
jgi:hypothetical protein